MQEAQIVATFGPAANNLATLPKASRATVEALFQHPIAHGLEWLEVGALFAKLGTVDQRPHKETVFGLGGEHRVVRKPHGKELPAAEAMESRYKRMRTAVVTSTSSTSDCEGNSIPFSRKPVLTWSALA